MWTKFGVVITVGALVGSCDLNNIKVEPFEPPDNSRYAKEYGDIDGRLKDLLQSERETGDEGAYGINAILWSSSLQTVSFMGIKAIDPSSGTLVTDWYRSSMEDKFEYQVTITISGKTLRSDAVNVSTALRNPSTQIGIGSSNQLSQQLKNAILMKAREIRQDRAGGL